MNRFAKTLAAFVFLAVSTFAQQLTYPFTLSPSFSTNVDKFAIPQTVRIEPAITLRLNDGVTGVRAFRAYIPPFTDINGNINSTMFSFSVNDGGPITYTGGQGLVYPNGTTSLYVSVDVSRLGSGSYTLPVIIQDLSTNFSQSVSIGLNIIDGRTYVYPAENVRVVPHLASGKGWRTQLQFTNPNESNSTVRVDFLDQFGQPLTVRLRDGRVNSTVYVDAFSHGTNKIVIEDLGATYTLVGSIRVTPVIGYPLGVTAIYESTDVPHAAALAAQQVNTDALTFFYDNTNGSHTGVAFLNSLNYPEPLTIKYYDEYGNLLTTTTEVLPANGQVSRTIDQVVPETRNRTGVIRATLPVGFKSLNGILLRFDSNFFFVPVAPIPY